MKDAIVAIGLSVLFAASILVLAFIGVGVVRTK